MKHQVTVKELIVDCIFLLASSHGKDEGKRLTMFVEPVSKSVQFNVMDTIKEKGKLCETLKEAVEIYNAI